MRRTQVRHALIGAVGVVGLGVPVVAALPAATASVATIPTTTTLEASPTSTSYGQNITFTINTHATTGPGSPAASVQLKDGGTVVASIPLSGGVATYNTTKVMVGTHNFTASFAGGTKYGASTSAPVEVTVAGAATTTVLHSPGIPDEGIGFVQGKTTLTFSASVTGDAPVGGSPKGALVDFFDSYDNGEEGSSRETSDIVVTKIGSSPIVGGVATISTNQLQGGFHRVWAVFNGGSIYSGSQSSSLAIVILRHETNITVDTDLPLDSDFIHSGVWGQTATLMADVSSGVDPLTPGQMMKFWGNTDGTLTYFGQAPIVNGHAELVTSTIPVEYYDLTACLSSGAYVFDSCSQTIPLGIQPADSTTTLTVSPSGVSSPGATVTMTAQVDAVAPGTGHPVANVTFYDGKVALATVPVGAGGTATYTTSSLSTGFHALMASFGGGTNFWPSDSDVVDHNVNS